MELAKKLIKEQEKQEWSQLMQQEEDGSSAMVVEEVSPEQFSQKKTAPTRGTWKSTGEGVGCKRRKCHVQTQEVKTGNRK